MCEWFLLVYFVRFLYQEITRKLLGNYLKSAMEKKISPNPIRIQRFGTWQKFENNKIIPKISPHQQNLLKMKGNLISSKGKCSKKRLQCSGLRKSPNLSWAKLSSFFIDIFLSKPWKQRCGKKEMKEKEKRNKNWLIRRRRRMDYGENCGNWRLAEILSVLKEQEEYKMSSRSSNVQQLQKSFIFKVGHVCMIFALRSVK